MGKLVATAALGRRTFIARAAWIGAGTVVAAGLDRVIPFRHGTARAASGVREIALEARQISWELAPGKTIKAMAYNGRVPGPEIRVKEGERIRVVLKNALVEPTTIHWHGSVGNMNGPAAAVAPPWRPSR